MQFPFRRVFPAIFLVIWNVAGAQPNKPTVAWANWVYQDRELFWSNVYKTDSIGVEALTKRANMYLRSRSYIRNIQSELGLVTADIAGLVIDYKKYKLPDTYIKRHIRDGKWYGRVMYELKGNRYRVTVTGAAVDLGTVGAAVASQNVAVASSNTILLMASEIFISKDELEVVDKEQLFTFHQFLLFDLELKRSVVARGTFRGGHTTNLKSSHLKSQIPHWP